MANREINKVCAQIDSLSEAGTQSRGYQRDSATAPGPPGLESLRIHNLFIVQQNLIGGCFQASRSYEVRDSRKQLLFRAHQARKYFFKSDEKINVCNLRKKTVFEVKFDNDGICGSASEATVFAPHLVARIIRYGGRYSHPSFEIANADNTVIFNIEPNESNNGLEYPIKSTRGRVAHVGVKSGLNFILNTAEYLTPVDKASLIGFIIAMDILKSGRQATQNNAYEYQQ